MCPKNLRTRLRPVNVCCAIVASHFVARQRRTFRSAIGIAPGLNFDTFRTLEAPGQDFNPELEPEISERKTTRGALDHTRPSQPSLHGLKKPEIACLPT